jgi:hypothetical protein
MPRRRHQQGNDTKRLKVDWRNRRMQVPHRGYLSGMSCSHPTVGLGQAAEGFEVIRRHWIGTSEVLPYTRQAIWVNDVAGARRGIQYFAQRCNARFRS